MRGDDFIFICGSDMHGTALEVRALRDKTDPKVLATQLHETAKSLFLKFGCNFTYYGSTHTEQNKEITDQIFNALYKNKYITETQHELPYCNTDKIFLADRFIEGKCPKCGYESARGDQCDKCQNLLDPKDLIEPHCTICGKKNIVFKKTKNLALDLEKLQPKLEKFFEQTSKNEWSKNAINETKKYFKEGLRPRDISRNTKWGFPVPLTGFEDQVFYVWFDAPIGYIGITKEWNAPKWESYWKAKDTTIVQFMGKDNIVFHSILFPGMLLGSDLGYTLVHTLKSYEFLNWEGKKFSKSRGIGMDMAEAISVVKDPDYWRFALMLTAPENADADFTTEGFVESVNKIMNGKIGNLLQRVLTLINTNKEIFDSTAKVDMAVSDKLDDLVKKYTNFFEKVELREALKTVVEITDVGNSLISEKEPWLIAKTAQSLNDPTSAKEFSVIMNTLLKISYTVGILIFPFVPNASARALKYFGIEKTPTLALLSKAPKLAPKLEPKPIFEKLTDEQIKKIKSYS